MDTTPKYTKMCEKAEEIQDLRNGFSSGYLGEIWLKDDRFQLHQGKVYVGGIWLPRQDQLQEMGKYKMSIHDGIQFLMNSFWSFLNPIESGGNEWKKDEKYIKQFNSLEQLWLAFVTKEKFNKIWDDKEERWNKERST